MENFEEANSDLKLQLTELYMSGAKEADVAKSCKMDESQGDLNSRLTMNSTETEKLYVLPIDKDPARSKRQRQLTKKGMEKQIELLKRNRSAAHGKLLLLIHKVKGFL